MPPDDPIACSLPSANSAADLMAGHPGAAARVASHMVLRGTLVALGVGVADRVRAWGGGEAPLPPERVLALGMGGSTAIEAFVLAWMLAKDAPAGAGTEALLSTYGPAALARLHAGGT